MSGDLESRRASVIRRAVARPEILEQWLRDLGRERQAATVRDVADTWGRAIAATARGELLALESELWQRRTASYGAPEFPRWRALHTVCRALLLVTSTAPPDETVLVCGAALFEVTREDFEVTARRMTNWQRAEIDLAKVAVVDAEVAQLDDLERRLTAVTL